MGHSGDTWTHFQSVFSKFQSEMKFVGITCISAVFLAFGHGFHSSQINFNGFVFVSNYSGHDSLN